MAVCLMAIISELCLLNYKDVLTKALHNSTLLQLHTSTRRNGFVYALSAAGVFSDCLKAEKHDFTILLVYY